MTMTIGEHVLISARGLSKKFCRDLRRSLLYGIQDIFAEIRCNTRAFGELRKQEFWALYDANFQLKRRQSLGIIGRNGAGKSTLLKLIAGLIKPDRGQITVRGRVGALIALGAGFNPILTGRENIQINAAVLGYSTRQLLRLIDDIVAFSELEEFIDTPVQNYSSGMYVRLGFSVAVHLAPDIMLVDEVLAVGDMGFQRKCFDRILSMREAGTSFIIVSHNPWQIESLCDKAAVVNRGVLSPFYPAKDAQAIYFELMQQGLGPQSVTARESREGTHTLYFSSVEVDQGGGVGEREIESGKPLSITATVVSTRPLRRVRFRFEICGVNNAIVAMVTTIGVTEEVVFDGMQRVIYHMSPCQLTTGWYYVNALAVDSNVRLDAWQRATEFKVLVRDRAARNLTSDVGAFVCQGRWEIG
jgi:homopolymeric O-antigen transport system ATP-binding protein